MAFLQKYSVSAEGQKEQINAERLSAEFLQKLSAEILQKYLSGRPLRARQRWQHIQPQVTSQLYLSFPSVTTGFSQIVAMSDRIPIHCISEFSESL